MFSGRGKKNQQDIVSVKNYSPMSAGARLIYAILISFGLYTLTRYVLWWFKPEHIPSNWRAGELHLIDFAIFALLSFIVFFALFLRIGTWFTIWFIKRPYHIPPPTGLRVAFLTCYVPGKEPLEMLKETLLAMRDVDYPHDTWVLDEGNDVRVKALCNELGIAHFSRREHTQYNQSSGHYRAKTKAGNLNAWRNEFEKDYDIVAQVDMDHKPHKDYLIKQIGYFTDPKVGYVVIPQIYKNTNNWIARGAAEQTHYYYGPLQQGLYGADMPFLIGTTHVYRVAAMEEFGGYAPTIAEDYLTSMHFSSHGWKGVYVPEVLAEGDGPTSWTDYFNQQMRWSYGLYEILFRHTHRHIFKLSNKQRINLFLSQLFYFSGLATMFGFVLTSLYLIFGINSADMKLQEWGIYAIPTYISSFLVLLFLHRYYINPRFEPKIGLIGAFLAQAANIIYTIALLNFITQKKLNYKVTTKGSTVEHISHLPALKTHILILFTLLLTLTLSFIYQHNSIVIRFWAFLNVILFALLIFAIYWQTINRLIISIKNHYKLFEFDTPHLDVLPSAPTDKEKYLYIKEGRTVFLIFSVLSFLTIQISMFNFFTNNTLLWPLLGYFVLTILYFSISLLTNAFSQSFDLNKHNKIISEWSPQLTCSVDIFLPTAGEPLEVLKNTWEGIKEMNSQYKGVTTVYCLDDANRKEVKQLAEEFNFSYVTRPNPGWYKKSGNLRHGFQISNSEFIAIFDADFRPRHDFLDELLPYFYEDKAIGLVQSPQYFDVHQRQNWLQRGAGAVQEFFYRISQVARQNHEASICVGSNALYRRSALKDIGGTVLIEHSEDVHTGFNMRLHGWKIQYVPIILAKGLCPADMKAFFKQQYRWCLGSMSLLSSKKFWRAQVSPMARLSYFSGFLYYIHTGLSAFIVPIIPIVLMVVYPEQINLRNNLFIMPSIFFIQFVYPAWHRATYGIEAWSTKSIYSWAHQFAIIDIVTGRKMGWQATGSQISKDKRYTIFRVLQFVFNFIPSVVWVGLSGFNALMLHRIEYLPLFLSGMYFFLMTAKVTFYRSKNFTSSHYSLKRRLTGPFYIFPTMALITLLILLFQARSSLRFNIKVVNPKYESESAILGKKDKNKTISPTGVNYYSGTAVQGDSLTKIVRGMMNTYSSETNDLLSIRERRIVEVLLVSKLPKKPLRAGDEIRVPRKVVEEAIKNVREIK